MGKPYFRPDPSIEDMVRRAQVHSAAGSQRGTYTTYHSAPGCGYWLIWLLGTFGAIGIWLLLGALGAHGDGMAWLFWVGVAFLVMNLWNAFVTGLYAHASGFGYGFAQFTGWAVIIGAALLIGLLVLAIGASAAGSASPDNVDGSRHLLLAAASFVLHGSKR